MLQTINYLRLSRTDSDEISVVEAKQGDNQGDICQIEIYDNQDIVDLSQFDDVLFSANKPDRSSVLFRLSDNKNLIKNGNILSLTLTDALLSMHGTVECELSLYKEKVIKSTYNFNIYVFKSPGSFDVMNQSDLTTFKNGISEIRDIRDEVKKSEENTKESENNAKISETNAKASEISATNSADVAKTKANEASASASAAKTSEQNAKASEIASSESEANALNYARQASDSKDAAKTSETNAKKSEQNADISASTASTKANESSASATLAKSYAIGGTNTRANEDTDNSKYYKEQASLFSSNADTSASNAKTSENNALNSANIATAKASAAATSASNAATSESSAKNYANQASTSASTASDKANTATNKAQEASTSAQNALNYSNQAKEYKDKCLQITQGLEGALIPMGTITFAELPTQDLKTGYMYNISNEFTSDNRFKDGNSKTYPAGTNIYYTQDEKWDVLVGDLSKYAFKTDFESHRDNKSNPHGVTKAQVGLGNVPNVTTNNQTVTYSDTTTLTTLSSGEKISIAFAKIKKAISDLISHLKDNIRHITNDERTLWNTVSNKADSSHSHSIIASKGTHVEAASGTTANEPTTGMADASAGMYMTQNYCDGNMPTSYGNTINLVGGGTGQLMCGWSSSDSTTGRMYYRSHRDTGSGGWGNWKTVAYTSDIPNDYLTTYASDGSSNLDCLKNAFSIVPKSVAAAVRLQRGSHSMALGWFLNDYGYENAYGGWFISDYGTPSWVGVDNGNWHSTYFITGENIGSQSVNYANVSKTIQGSYTSNGGQQKPNYFGKNKVGFLMMNTPINGDNHYKDFLIMDCYDGNDVGGGTAFGIDRQEMRAFIMGSNASRDSWSRSAELITNLNISSQSVNYANSAGSAPASDVYSWAKQKSKPSYTWSEIGSKPSTFTPASHTHGTITDGAHTWTATEIYDWFNSKANMAEYIRSVASGEYQRIANLYTLKSSNNALISGDKGIYIFGISSFSDSRIKINVDKSKVEALDLINGIGMYEYDFIDAKYGEHSELGYIAQQLIEVIPECVVSVPQDREQMGYDELYQVQDVHLIPYLVKAVQELSSKVNELEKKISEMG